MSLNSLVSICRTSSLNGLEIYAGVHSAESKIWAYVSLYKYQFSAESNKIYFLFYFFFKTKKNQITSGIGEAISIYILYSGVVSKKQ